MRGCPPSSPPHHQPPPPRTALAQVLLLLGRCSEAGTAPTEWGQDGCILLPRAPPAHGALNPDSHRSYSIRGAARGVGNGAGWQARHVRRAWFRESDGRERDVTAAVRRAVAKKAGDSPVVKLSVAMVDAQDGASAFDLGRRCVPGRMLEAPSFQSVLLCGTALFFVGLWH